MRKGKVKKWKVVIVQMDGSIHELVANKPLLKQLIQLDLFKSDIKSINYSILEENA